MGRSHVWLTCVDFLQRDMLLQLPAEANLSAVLSTRPVISKDEVGVAAVQDWQLAERVGHCLIRPGHLKHETPCFTQVRNSTFCCQVFYYINICKHCRLRLRLVCLTSLPIRSSLFSTIPHGAIPIAQTFPLDFEEWSFRASPTWRMTPGEKKKKKSHDIQNDSFWCQRTAMASSHLCIKNEGCTCTDSSSEDPGSSGDSSFDQPFTKDLLQLGRQVKVLEASMNRDE